MNHKKKVKGDSKIIALVTRKLVAAEAHYHRSCYRNYTRQTESGVDNWQIIVQASGK